MIAVFKKKTPKNRCYTYFSITGDFEPDEVTKMLGLAPYETHRIGDMFPGGKSKYDFAGWKFGKCEEYDVYVENQMRKTLEPLLGKTEVLKEIKRKYDVAFFLEVVPTVHRKESTPCLAPTLEIMKFCVETDTEIDIDLYVY